MSIEWVFDPAQPSGSRTAGSSAEYCFDGNIDTLVREVIQNSKDAKHPASGPGSVEVSFRLIDLDGAHLDAFNQAACWNGLVDNLQAVNSSRGGSSIKAGLDRLHDQQKLRLLVIEDRNTKGLEGTERRGANDAEENPFCSLVKDELYSDKSDHEAGGSFGLGKAMLWAHSVFNTVLFSSVPATPPGSHQGTRFIGSVILPWHSTTSDGGCSGRGWLGTRHGHGYSRYADSKWVTEPDADLNALFCARDGACGLTAVIVGFEEPGGDPHQEPIDILNQIESSVMASFWPALVRNELAVNISHEVNGNVERTLVVNPTTVSDFEINCKMLKDYDDGLFNVGDRLEAVGECTIQLAKLKVPECTHPGQEHPAFEAEVPVLVRLLEKDSSGNRTANMIQAFRKPGMIVRGEEQKNLHFDARTFTAMVLGGSAPGAKHSNARVERFLRAAEPPAHDRWIHDTAAIKQRYRSHGVKKMLKDFQNSVRQVITDVVVPARTSGGALPKSVLKHLAFGGVSSEGVKGFITLTNTRLAPDGAGGWTFSVKCHRREPGPESWKVSVVFKLLSDGGGMHQAGEVLITSKPHDCTLASANEVEFPGSLKDGIIRGEINSRTGAGTLMRSRVSLQIVGEVI